jgi:hypothetical protein
MFYPFYDRSIIVICLKFSKKYTQTFSHSNLDLPSQMSNNYYFIPNFDLGWDVKTQIFNESGLDVVGWSIRTTVFFPHSLKLLNNSEEPLIPSSQSSVFDNFVFLLLLFFKCWNHSESWLKKGWRGFFFLSLLTSFSLSLDASHQTWKLCEGNLIGCWDRYF